MHIDISVCRYKSQEGKTVTGYLETQEVRNVSGWTGLDGNAEEEWKVGDVLCCTGKGLQREGDMVLFYL